MVSLITLLEAQKILSKNIRTKRLSMNLTQDALSKRSGVALPTLRKFEQKSSISLGSFLKILMALGLLDDFLQASKKNQHTFLSIDDVINSNTKVSRKRGRRK
ncbi:MAG: helix-turn-helix transcriptional regulator [Bdellovibrionales bacterium]|nr:helix-turn-helix transcriptional regulator [Bdellovibrionales bacterium]